MGKIISFSGKYDFLSNFYPSTLQFRDMSFPSVEHAYQAWKTTDPGEFLRIKNCDSPTKAKKLGRNCKIRADWNLVKLSIMEEIVREKFKNSVLMKRLKDTYPCMLVEGNSWGDKYWGVCEGVGENHMGRVLMKIRDEEIEKGEERK